MPPLVPQICSRVDKMARKAVGAKFYGLVAAPLQQPKGKGGIGFILPPPFLKYIHSKWYVQWMRYPESLPVVQAKAPDTWG